ncbi:aspartate/glutamate racemase family protein [Papillibacter cinnamivorans]|uniref:Hydantoin racemase n=1 Tax=Papillibacter cinnamivorans DSM 12816 TaxID=1122930 RepID=A0A1W2BFT2_9FIRM|nr:aspartate/glutamate racemase family protein [Papillibacter cinnamivorans]SMC71674.1 allantoin racemase [Papillibacter cinnamivorans DSM 12816]
MRIKIINPNTTQAMTDGIYRAALSAASPDTEIVAVSPRCGPVSIESWHDEVFAAAGVVEEVHRGEELEGGFDAYITACYGDPGLNPAREVTDKPVVGIAEASMHLATFVGYKFSVVTILPRWKMVMEEVIGRYGLKERCASVRCTPMEVLEFERDPEKGARELYDMSLRAIREDEAEAICLGCAGMVDFAADLQEKLGVPVFDGVTAAVVVAEALVRLNKKTSKNLYYNYPNIKEYTNCPEIISPK